MLSSWRLSFHYYEVKYNNAIYEKPAIIYIYQFRMLSMPQAKPLKKDQMQGQGRERKSNARFLVIGNTYKGGIYSYF